jgi:PIN domain nuclease of toxin-antitoxin system
MTGAVANGLLLDTYAVIRRAEGLPLAPSSLAVIAAAAAAGRLYISPVSAWEVGLLSRPERKYPMRFLPDAHTWFARTLAEPGVHIADLTWDIALAASHLPAGLHGDPGDRLLVATARALDLKFVTSDSRIIAYARAGHISAIPC